MPMAPGVLTFPPYRKGGRGETSVIAAPPVCTPTRTLPRQGGGDMRFSWGYTLARHGSSSPFVGEDTGGG
jgi:hypothetical protein